MPFTGWWMVRLVGWPLGQTWLLASSVLYTVAALGWFWLLVRLNRLRTAPGGNGKFTLALALFSFVCFVAIAGVDGRQAGLRLETEATPFAGKPASHKVWRSGLDSGHAEKPLGAGFPAIAISVAQVASPARASRLQHAS